MYCSESNYYDKDHEGVGHVFEGFMDYLSYLILHGECDAVVLNSIVNIPNVLPILNKYSQIWCHLDNDTAGRMATRQIMEHWELSVLMPQMSMAHIKTSTNI